MRTNELAKVKEFQDMCDTPCSAAGTLMRENPIPAIELNQRIVIEEISETLDGVRANDIVEIADGAADSLYVIAHAINQLGRGNNTELANAAHVLLAEAISRAGMVLTPGAIGVTEADIDRNLAYAEIVVRGVAAAYGIPLDAVFNEVHRSNMTKAFPDGKVRKDAGGKVIKPDTYDKARVKEILLEEGIVQGE